jgi:hypothetical protein
VLEVGAARCADGSYNCMYQASARKCDGGPHGTDRAREEVACTRPGSNSRPQEEEGGWMRGITIYSVWGGP